MCTLHTTEQCTVHTQCTPLPYTVHTMHTVYTLCTRQKMHLSSQVTLRAAAKHGALVGPRQCLVGILPPSTLPCTARHGTACSPVQCSALSAVMMRQRGSGSTDQTPDAGVSWWEMVTLESLVDVYQLLHVRQRGAWGWWHPSHASCQTSSHD